MWPFFNTGVCSSSSLASRDFFFHLAICILRNHTLYLFYRVRHHICLYAEQRVFLARGWWNFSPRNSEAMKKGNLCSLSTSLGNKTKQMSGIRQKEGEIQ